MTQTLKPCPFCGGNSISFRNTPDMDTDGKFHRISCNECGASSRATFAMDACPIFFEELSKAWNTRPAPAATDTGLETVGVQYAHEHSITGRAMWGWQKEWKGCAAIGTRELVTRSQAEELLAAKDAAIKRWRSECEMAQSQNVELAEHLAKAEADVSRWHQKAMDAGVITHSDGTTSHPMRKERDDLKADNAAQAARINGFEGFLDDLAEILGCERDIGDVVNEIDAINNRTETLEAKLAAAEKALEPFADIADLIDAETEGMAETDELVLHFHDYEFAKWPVSLFRKVRAVLGGKPS